MAPSEYSLKAVKQEPFVRAISDPQLAADIAQRRFEPRQAAEILEHAVKLIKHRRMRNLRDMKSRFLRG